MSTCSQDRSAAASLITRSIDQHIERTYFIMLLENTILASVQAITHGLRNAASSEIVSRLHDSNATLDAALPLPITAGNEYYPQILDLLNRTCRQCVIEAATDALGEGFLWHDCDAEIVEALETLNVDPSSLPEGVLKIDEVCNYIDELRDSVITELSSVAIFKAFRRTADTGLLCTTPNSESFSRRGMDNHENREHHQTQTEGAVPVHIEIAHESSLYGFNVHSVRATLTGKDGQPIGHASFGTFGLDDVADTGPDTLNSLINRYDERFSRMTPLRVPGHLVSPLAARGRILFAYHLEVAVEHRGSGLGLEFAKACVSALKSRFPDLRSLLFQVLPLGYLDVSPSAMPIDVRRLYQDDSRQLANYLSQYIEAFAKILDDDEVTGLCLSFAPEGVRWPVGNSSSQDTGILASSMNSSGDFRNRIPVLRSRMMDEYLSSPGAARSCLPSLDPSVYEFEWGFIAEFPFFEGYGWEVVAKRAWETGIDNWHDRFLTAYKNIIYSIERDFEDSVPEEDSFNITFDDGRMNFTSMSFACLRNAEAGRKHFVDAYVEGYLPDVMRAVFDPDHDFRTDWNCVEPPLKLGNQYPGTR